MITIAHLSDPHVPSPLALAPRDLLNKRLFGYINWITRRRHVHRLAVLDLLAADLAAQRPGHIAITGDLANLSLPSEFPAVSRWLQQLGTPQTVSIVPGNHDAYVRLPGSLALWPEWRAYMSSDAVDGGPARVSGAPAAPATAVAGNGFPYLRRRSRLAIVGVSTAIPTAPGVSSGLVGAGQLQRLRTLLSDLRREPVFRLVLLHHPPLATTTARHKGLRDAAALRAVLAETGAELLLHGHDHRFRHRQIDGGDGPIPVIGVPSASALAKGGRPAACYHLYHITAAPGGWRIEVCSRRLDAALGRFNVSFHFNLHLRRALASWPGAAAVDLAAPDPGSVPAVHPRYGAELLPAGSL
jgi:3',5'-cyclic AMP phosphodiesterase CpdA